MPTQLELHLKRLSVAKLRYRNANTSIVEQPYAHITLEVQNNLTDFQAWLFFRGWSEQEIIPIPIGVAVDYVFFGESIFFFGFYEDPNASTLSTLESGYGFGYGLGYGTARAGMQVLAAISPICDK